MDEGDARARVVCEPYGDGHLGVHRTHERTDRVRLGARALHKVQRLSEDLVARVAAEALPSGRDRQDAIRLRRFGDDLNDTAELL